MTPEAPAIDQVPEEEASGDDDEGEEDEADEDEAAEPLGEGGDELDT